MQRTTIGLLVSLSLFIALLAAEAPPAGSQYGVSEPSTPDLIRLGVPWYDTRGERISALRGAGVRCHALEQIDASRYHTQARQACHIA